MKGTLISRWMKVLIKRAVSNDTNRYCRSLSSRALQILAVDECGLDVNWKNFSRNVKKFCNSTFNQNEAAFDRTLKLFCKENRQEEDSHFWKKTGRLTKSSDHLS